MKNKIPKLIISISGLEPGKFVRIGGSFPAQFISEETTSIEIPMNCGTTAQISAFIMDIKMEQERILESTKRNNEQAAKEYIELENLL